MRWVRCFWSATCVAGSGQCAKSHASDQQGAPQAAEGVLLLATRGVIWHVVWPIFGSAAVKVHVVPFIIGTLQVGVCSGCVKLSFGLRGSPRWSVSAPDGLARSFSQKHPAEALGWVVMSAPLVFVWGLSSAPLSLCLHVFERSRLTPAFAGSV